MTKLYSDQKLEMSALDVFKHSIAFIKGELLRELKKQGILSTTLKTQIVKENEDRTKENKRKRNRMGINCSGYLGFHCQAIHEGGC